MPGIKPINCKHGALFIPSRSSPHSGRPPEIGRGKLCAGGVALNQTLGTPRLSRGIDLFHDTAEALAFSWSEDRLALAAAGYTVDVVRESPSFVEPWFRSIMNAYSSNGRETAHIGSSR